MGVVYRATDTRLNRSVALKFLPLDRSHNETRQRRLLQEAQAASALNHPNILTIYDIGEYEGQTYIVMEFVDGKSLEDLLADGPLKERAICKIVTQVADGLKAAHDNGIIHRDIKPANVMIRNDGRAKIMDFGLAKIAGASTLTEEGGVLGTAAYMSPEQARGEPVDARSDIWSLGVMLYEMIAGSRPFQGAYLPALIYSVLNENPEYPGSTDAIGSEPLRDVAMMCLEKDPANRYQDAGALLGDLEVLQSGTGSALTASSRDTVNRPDPRARKAIFLSVIAFVIILVVLILRSLVLSDNGAGRIRQVAIMPIVAIGETPVSEVVAEGLLYSVTSQLAGMREYRDAFSVIPASEMLVLGSTNQSISALPFDVDVVVRGTIQRSGDILRLSFDLVDTRTTRSINSTRIDAASDNMLAFQDQAATALAGLLEPSVALNSDTRLPAGATTKPGAYEYYLQGRGYIQRFTLEANVDAAIDLFQRAIEEDPDYALAHAGLGEAYMRKYDLTRNIDWVDRAELSALRAQSLAENLAPVQITLGLINRRKGRPEAAIAAYERALEIDPEDGGTNAATLGIANAYYDHGDFEEAETWFLRAISMRPDIYNGYMDLGFLYTDLNRNQEAAEQFLRVTELAPDNIFGYNNLATIYEREGRPEDAIPLYEKAISMDDQPMPYRNLGAIYYFDQHDYARAADIYEQALTLNQIDFRTWSSLASAYFWTPGRTQDAFNAWERVIELARGSLSVNPRDPEALGAIAGALANTNREADALEVLSSMSDLDVLDDDALLSMALAYEALQMRDSSLAYVERAFEAGVNEKYVMKSPFLDQLRSDPGFLKPPGR